MAEEQVYEYGNTWGRLLTETALIAFMKKDGHARLMLGTRNTDTAKMMWPDKHLKGLLGGFDNRCNIGNGNIGVIDLAIGDCRSFGIDRVIAIKWLGELATEDDINNAIEEYERIESDMQNQFGYTVSGGEAKALNKKDDFNKPIIF